MFCACPRAAALRPRAPTFGWTPPAQERGLTAGGGGGSMGGGAAERARAPLDGKMRALTAQRVATAARRADN